MARNPKELPHDSPMVVSFQSTLVYQYCPDIVDIHPSELVILTEVEELELHLPGAHTLKKLTELLVLNLGQ